MSRTLIVGPAVENDVLVLSMRATSNFMQEINNGLSAFIEFLNPQDAKICVGSQEFLIRFSDVIATVRCGCMQLYICVILYFPECVC